MNGKFTQRHIFRSAEFDQMPRIGGSRRRAIAPALRFCWLSAGVLIGAVAQAIWSS